MMLPARRGPDAATMSRNQRWWAITSCCLSLLLVGMDSTIVNVALPSIKRDLGASLSDLQWITDGYVVVVGALVIFGGSLGDRLGRRRTFMAGIVIFVLASILCSLAPASPWLIATRMIQGVGGSMLNPVAMSIITNVVHNPRERAQAIGVWSGIFGLSLGLGPAVGGLLVEAAGWRSIFWINLPLGLASLLLVRQFVPESRSDTVRRFDPVGQMLVGLAILMTIYAIIDAPSAGWASVRVVGILLGSATVLTSFAWYEFHRLDPLVDPRFFRSHAFSAATLTAVLAFACFAGFQFVNTLYLQDAKGLSAREAGLYSAPVAIVILIAGPSAGWLVSRRGPRILLMFSACGWMCAGVLLHHLGARTSGLYLVMAYAFIGLAFGFVNTPITNTVVTSIPRQQAGMAAAVASSSRQIGSALGIAIGGSIVNSQQTRSPSELASAAHPVWWCIAIAGFLVLLLSRFAARVPVRELPDAGSVPSTARP